MKPLSEQQLKRKVTDICFENGGVTKPMADKLTALILQDRQAWGEYVIGEDDAMRVKTYSSPTWTSGRYCSTCGFDIEENTNVCACTEINKTKYNQRKRNTPKEEV